MLFIWSHSSMTKSGYSNVFFFLFFFWFFFIWINFVRRLWKYQFPIYKICIIIQHVLELDLSFIKFSILYWNKNISSLVCVNSKYTWTYSMFSSLNNLIVYINHKIAVWCVFVSFQHSRVRWERKNIQTIIIIVVLYRVRLNAAYKCEQL